MGKTLENTEFTDRDFRNFSARLGDNLAALKQLLADPGFGKGPGSLGAELEMYIIDRDGNPMCKNMEILERVNDPLLTLELNRFNLEYNLNPVPIQPHPFSVTEQHLLKALADIEQQAGHFGGRIVYIGILPTLDFQHFGPHAMTDAPRYHALKKRLREIRGGLFRVSITGKDELLIETDDITFEGANTSFQLHYRVDPAEFADSYNTLQLITPLVLAVAGNSPTAFGKRLWHETRIPLFKKSIDYRKAETLDRFHWHQPSRVNFGQGWLRQGAYELFAETVRLYPTLLPVVGDEDPFAALQEGRTPKLSELQVHEGTVWLWNRPVYDPADGGHLRVEMRFLPSGPSAKDMLANAALAVGLMEGLKPQVSELLTALPFQYAIHNFYRAAEHGLDARVVWPNLKASAPDDKEIRRVLENLLPVAEEGLARVGIAPDESRKYLGIIERRLERGVTGAVWQLRCYEKLREKFNDRMAFHAMLENYYAQSRENIPVADWQMMVK